MATGRRSVGLSATWPRESRRAHSTLGDFNLMVRTEAHQIELSGDGLPGDALPMLISDGCQLLEEVATLAALRGWTECYDQDLSVPNLVARSHWEWTPKR